MKKVSWGILGTGNFAQQKFIPGLQGSAASELRAIASRSRAICRSVRSSTPVVQKALRCAQPATVSRSKSFNAS